MFTKREHKRCLMIALAASLVTGSFIVSMSTMPMLAEIHEIYHLVRGPIIAIGWLITPAILIIGSIVAGLLFHAVSRLWATE